MKKILVITSRLPFVYGGNAVLARTLSNVLNEAGYVSDIWYTPQNRFGRQTTAYLANRFTDVGFTGTNEAIDQVISIRFPSFAVKHPHHVCWLNHCMREYYDLWETHRQHLPSSMALLKEQIRKRIFRIRDRYLLGKNVTSVFAQSKNIADRLKKFLGISAEVLYPPPRNDLSYNPGPYENYILSVSRLNKRKRHDLFISSFSHLKKTGMKGIIVGDGEERENLEKLIARENLTSVVQLVGDVTTADLGRIYANALAVFFAPVDEDYGNVTLEAFRFARPVITAPDSGGPLEFVKHMETGIVVDPDPCAIAEAFTALLKDKKNVEEMGHTALELSAGITWDHTIPRLIINP